MNRVPKPVGEFDHPDHGWKWTELELRWVAARDQHWQEEARRYASNADFWREKCERDTALLRQCLEALEYEAQAGNDDAYSELRNALKERLK